MKNTKTEINFTEIDAEDLASVSGGFMPFDLRRILEIIRKLRPTLLPSTPPVSSY